MSLSQTLTSRRDADLLQRALDGDPGALGHRLLADDEPGGLAALLRLTDELPHPRVRPDPAFVARLRDELLAEARQRPAPAVAAGRGARSSAPAPTGVRTLTVPRGGRLLAGLATMVLVFAAVLGGASTGALPGDALYPVKLMIGDAQVRLAGTDLGRGKALLGQLDRRLDEVDALVAAGNPPPSLVDETLARASDDLGDAQRQLLTTDSGTPDPQALQVLSDAEAQAIGRLAGLRQRVPIASVAGVDRLLEQLAAGQRAMMQQLNQLVAAGTCGGACGSIRTALEQQGAQLSRLLGAIAGGAGVPALVSDPASPHPGQAGSAVDPGGSLGSAVGGAGLATTPAAPAAGSLSVQLPGATLPGVTGDTGGGLVATVPGPTVSLPGASVAVPSVTVGLPSTTSTGLPLPEATVPETTTTVGGVTVPLPGASVGGDCVLGLGDLCLGS